MAGGAPLNPFACISFVLDDKHWLGKLALAALCALFMPVLVGWWLLYGWSVEVARRTLAGHAEPLPAWNKPLPLLHDGLRGGLTYVIYLLPFALLEASAWVLRSYVGGVGGIIATVLGLLAALWLLLASYWMVGVTLVLARGGGLRQALDLRAVRALLRDNATPYQVAFIAMLLLSPLLILGGSLFLGIGALLGIGWSFAFAGRLSAQAYVTARE